VYHSGGDDSLARRYTHPTSSAHSSSGLGHRPLTAAARVRIPYGPSYRSQPRGFRMVTRVRRVRGATNAHTVLPLVLPRRVVRSDTRTILGRKKSSSSRVYSDGARAVRLADGSSPDRLGLPPGMVSRSRRAVARPPFTMRTSQASTPSPTEERPPWRQIRSALRSLRRCAASPST
jgi:hypothetical protein